MEGSLQRAGSGGCKVTKSATETAFRHSPISPL